MNDQKENEQNISIMVIDDSDLSRKAIIETLTNANYNVVGEAKSAEEALQSLGTTNANIYIIDVVMPEISGLDLAKKLTEVLKDINIIMVSSLVTENIVIESISSGAVDFIQKPFEPEILLQSVEKVIKQIAEDS